jgi:hypothetical protein
VYFFFQGYSFKSVQNTHIIQTGEEMYVYKEKDPQLSPIALAFKMLDKKGLPQHCLEVSGRSCVPITFPVGTDRLYRMNTWPNVLDILENIP